jgi:hypothetical protein
VNIIIGYETYLSAEPKKTKDEAWFPEPNADQERSVGAEAKKEQRAQEADRISVSMTLQGDEPRRLCVQRSKKSHYTPEK